jgi:hypothetical protein
MVMSIFFFIGLTIVLCSIPCVVCCARRMREQGKQAPGVPGHQVATPFPHEEDSDHVAPGQPTPASATAGGQDGDGEGNSGEGDGEGGGGEDGGGEGDDGGDDGE